MDNANTAEYLEKIKNQVIDNIRRTMHKPSVQMTDIPPNPHGMGDEADAIMNDEDEEMNSDTRHSARQWDLHTEKDGELSESEDEEANLRNGVRITRNRRRNIMDYQNSNAAPDDDEVISNAAASLEAPAITNGDSHQSVTSPTPGSSRISPPMAVADEDIEVADEDIEMADHDTGLGRRTVMNEISQVPTPEASPEELPEEDPKRIARAELDDVEGERHSVEEPETEHAIAEHTTKHGAGTDET